VKIEVLDALLVHANVKQGKYVLDVGCGTRASVLALAERVRTQGQVVGLDLPADSRLGAAAHRS
jgi:ubiquinone/menaquinone biosynthesis C-methylase UbiE